MTEQRAPERSRDGLLRAAEAASRAEAQAQRAHRHAMLLSLRAALVHDQVAAEAARVGMPAQAQLHEELAARARSAARGEALSGEGGRQVRLDRDA
jgi:hypothetical protein